MNIEEMAHQMALDYKRAWQARNRDRVKEYQRRYWTKKAEAALQADGVEAIDNNTLTAAARCLRGRYLSESNRKSWRRKAEAALKAEGKPATSADIEQVSQSMRRNYNDEIMKRYWLRRAAREAAEGKAAAAQG